MIPDSDLSEMVRQSMEPAFDQESRAAVRRLVDEVRRLREAIRRHRDSWSKDFEAVGSSACAYDQDLWAAIGE